MGRRHGMCNATPAAGGVQVGARVCQLCRGETGSREETVGSGGVHTPCALDAQRVGLARRDGAVAADLLYASRVRLGRRAGLWMLLLCALGLSRGIVPGTSRRILP